MIAKLRESPPKSDSLPRDISCPGYFARVFAVKWIDENGVEQMTEVRAEEPPEKLEEQRLPRGGYF